jgi:hypothetical protein
MKVDRIPAGMGIAQMSPNFFHPWPACAAFGTSWHIYGLHCPCPAFPATSPHHSFNPQDTHLHHPRWRHPKVLKFLFLACLGSNSCLF